MSEAAKKRIASYAETPFDERQSANNVWQLVSETAAREGARPALSFQIKSGERDKAETLSWAELHRKTGQAANLFRRLGVGRKDVVAFLLPNANETVITLLGGMTAGVVNPVNPLLTSAQIAHILNTTGAKVLVTLAPFPKSDLAQKAAEALKDAPGVKEVLTVDLAHYLSPPVSWIASLMRPKTTWPAGVTVRDFNRALKKEPAALSFADDAGRDDFCAFFHTGGTTGTPKVAQLTHRGALYQGWVGTVTVLGREDVMLLPLPMFHVYAAFAALFAVIATGAHCVMPTPQGYRGDGVFDNFWKLVERWKVTFATTVPTAAAALLQRKVNADISSLKYMACGSAPLPRELYRQFEEATGVTILEGYGMTEATCMISGNPFDGEQKIGSVGLPVGYSDVRILDCAPDGTVNREMATGEIGEICVSNPGIFPGYMEASRNEGLFTDGGYLRTGDLGRLDEDGYLWITGRAKDLIIRGGHNIDPALIEEALMMHPSVCFAGAIGQPDAKAGELPCAYVELKDGASCTAEELQAFAAEHIAERPAAPKYVEVMDELPKTQVGKVFKPALRAAAISRVYNAALKPLGASVTDVVEDKETGLTAIVEGGEDAKVQEVLGLYPRPWRRAG